MEMEIKLTGFAEHILNERAGTSGKHLLGMVVFVRDGAP